MQRSLVLLVCLIAIAAAVSTWFWWPRDPAVPRYRDPNRIEQPGQTQPSTSNDGTGTGTGTGEVTHIPIPEKPQPRRQVAERVLQVQLRGLHEQAPWTSDLQFELKDRTRGRRYEEHNTQGKVSADGRCSLKLPPWWQPGMTVRVRINAHNEGYRNLYFREQGALALNDVLEIDVQAIATVRGNVVDSRENPVANARITAFAMRNGQPFGNSVGATGTDRDGNYTLAAPPDTELLIVATAMKPNVMRWRSMDGVNDSGYYRGDLLPVAHPLQLAIDRPHEVRFRLPDAASIRGKVVWPDDSAVENAHVHFHFADGVELSLGYHAKLIWQRDGSLTCNGTADVDRDGRFVIPAAAGTAADVQVTAIGELQIVGELPVQRLAAGSQAELMMPFPVTVRAIHRGQLVPHARVLVHGRLPLRSERDGTSRILFAEDVMVRTEQGPLRSPWQSLRSSHLEQTIDMVMHNHLVEVQIEFEGAVPVRNAQFTWKCQDGRTATERLQRGDNSGPFRLWLEPDNYTLLATAGPGERNGTYLLPVERTFSTRDTRELTLPAEFGGTFKLQVLDDRGRFVAGKCSVRGIDGKERAVNMKTGAEPGVFGAETSRCTDVLAPGPYELLIDIDGSGKHKRYVQIKELETTPVVLRL